MTDDCTVTGVANTWSLAGDSGARSTFSFCPHCGSTVFFRADAAPETTAVPLGIFTDGEPLIPKVSVYDNRQRSCVAILGDDVDHPV